MSYVTLCVHETATWSLVVNKYKYKIAVPGIILERGGTFC